jgi:hypothetical protein
METLSLRNSCTTHREEFKQLDSINELINTRSIFSNGMIYADARTSLITWRKDNMTINNHRDRVKREKQGIGNIDAQLASTIKNQSGFALVIALLMMIAVTLGTLKVLSMIWT